jgi:tetratricopeptide (TPR) repeat protein
LIIRTARGLSDGLNKIPIKPMNSDKRNEVRKIIAIVLTCQMALAAISWASGNADRARQPTPPVARIDIQDTDLYHARGRVQVPFSIAQLAFAGLGLCCLIFCGTGKRLILSSRLLILSAVTALTREVAVQQYMSMPSNVASGVFNTGIALGLWRLSLGCSRSVPPEQTPVQTAQGLLAAKDYNRAQQILEDVCRAAPADAEIRFLLGVVHQEKGEFRQAVFCYSVALQIRPDYGDAYCNRGGCRAELGELDAAISDFTELTRLGPADPAAFYNRAVALYSASKYELALTDLNRALVVGPDYVAAIRLRGCVRHELGNYQGALSDFTDAIERNGQDHAAFTGRAAAYFKLDRLDDALADANSALRITQKPLLLSNRATILSKLGDFENALKDIERAIEIEEPGGHVLNEASWLLATCPIDAIRDGHRSVEYGERACALSEWKKATYIGTLSAAYAEVGEYDRAIELLERAMADPSYRAEFGDLAETRLALYRSGTPYRQPEPA